MPRSARLDAPKGRLVDRTRSVRFRFEGADYAAFAGDTIASALAAHGVWLTSRSFKYHRPRAPMSFAGYEANTLVQLGKEPNVWGDLHQVRDGDRVEPQNVFGSLANDRAAWLGTFARFMPVGFYYRTFFGTAGSWDRWEPTIRAMAGLGRVPQASRHEATCDKQFVHCDVAVVGGGRNGLQAANAAAEMGADVVLIEQLPRVGGSLLYARMDERLRQQALDGVVPRPDVRVLTDSTCTGIFDQNWLSVISGERLYKIRAGKVVLAQGSIEQLPVFRNNDVPGVILASGAQRLIHLYGVRPGTTAVVVAADDRALGAALDLVEAGCRVAAIAWIGNGSPSAQFLAHLKEAGTRCFSAVRDVQAYGRGAIESVRIEDASDGVARVACDLLVVSAGRSPAWQLAAQAGLAVRFDATVNNFVVDAESGLVQAVGSLAARSTLSTWRGAEGRAKSFVDLDEDLQPRDLRESVRLGFRDMQLLKRFSTTGMGPSQGRHSGAMAVRLAAEASGLDYDAVGLATARPPVGVEKVAHLAGRSFDPYRRTALHEIHVVAGATMMPAGAWVRPAHYGPTRDHIADEVRAVRYKAGLFDVGTLGGLDVRGPDAAEFLERLYTGRFAAQKVGGIRYGLMTDEAGTIIDDGVVARFSGEHFYVTTTSANSDAVYRKMLWWNQQWRLRVDVTNVTSAYCGMNLSGPASREILGLAGVDIDLTRERFGYMQAREGRVAEVDGVRVLRVGFLGELGYELHVPSRWATKVWSAVMAAGQAHGLEPIGVEAQRVLRLEKGHVIVGQDTDGITTPAEAGMEWAVATDKPFFVGQRALRIRGAAPASRKLVAWRMPRSAAPRLAEGLLVLHENQIVGNVTSFADSEALDALIGLAFARAADAAPGSSIHIKGLDGEPMRAEVCAIPFYDPQGARQKL
jgi:sarcosine oxidase, subunit alpha